METKPLIILLGGTYGVGKTTVAHHLGVELSIMQRAGLGGITKTIKTLLPDDEVVKGWHRYDRTDREQVRAKLLCESQMIGRIIATIVDSAERSGESYIIDGVQLLPQFLPMSKLHLFILAVPDKDEHRQRFEHPTITRTCHLNNGTFELAQLVQSIILDESRPFGIPVVDNLSLPKATAATIGKMLTRMGASVPSQAAAAEGCERSPWEGIVGGRSRLKGKHLCKSAPDCLSGRRTCLISPRVLSRSTDCSTASTPNGSRRRRRRSRMHSWPENARWAYWGNYPRPTGLIVAGYAVMRATLLLLLVAPGLVVDIASGKADRRLLKVLVASASGMFGLNIGANLMTNRLVAQTSARIMNDIRYQLFQHLQRLSLGYYGRMQTGDIVARFTSDLTEIESMMTKRLPDTIPDLIGLLLALPLAFTLQWQLTASHAGLVCSRHGGYRATRALCRGGDFAPQAGAGRDGRVAAGADVGAAGRQSLWPGTTVDAPTGAAPDRPGRKRANAHSS